MEFYLTHTDGEARAGVLKTAHSEIATPVFMPVGTQASVKALDMADIEALNAQIILANTYHLYLRPGDEVVAKMGGLHGFTTYKKSFLTDSGGFQAFSLEGGAKVKEDGIKFKSHIDGSTHLFTPEKVIDIQYNLGSDIMMVLDDLVALPAEAKRIKASVERTAQWAKQSLEHHVRAQNEGRGLYQNIFAIVQGGTSEEFRRMCAEMLTEIRADNRSFDGFAIGGLSVGEPPKEMYETVEITAPLLPRDKPRYLMGVGTPEDLVENVARGVDMFDCVMPTRNARNGTLFTSSGRFNIKGAKYILDDLPLDSECSCPVCKRYTKAYLAHLYRAKELSFFRLASIHNLHYYLSLMRQMREAIEEERFAEFKKEFYNRLLS